MTWGIIVNYDADQDNVGTINATWTDLVFGVFTYSKRIKANVAGGNAFIAEAIFARDAWQVKQQANIAGAAWALNKINLTDPKMKV